MFRRYLPMVVCLLVDQFGAAAEIAASGDHRSRDGDHHFQLSTCGNTWILVPHIAINLKRLLECKTPV
jgi:hypothetical protein